MSIYGRFYFRPGEGEAVTTRLCCASRQGSSIMGAVRTEEGECVSGAMALLFRVPRSGEPELLAEFVTDEEGHFFFGPLESGELYLVKVFKSALEKRELEIAGA